MENLLLLNRHGNLLKTHSQVLPYDCEIRYIESTGLEYIDTGFKPTNNTRVYAQMKTVASTSYGRLFGCVNGTSYNSTPNFVIDHETNYNGTLNMLWGNSNSWQKSSINGDYDIHTYDLNKGILYRDGVLALSMSQTSFQVSVNLAIFSYMKSTGITTDSSEFFKGRVYWFKIYENNVIVRDFIPVRVGQVGYLYDKVSGQLFGNEGTGAFKLGPDIYTVLDRFVIDGYEAVDLELTGIAEGLLWASCNVGNVAGFEYEGGTYYQWGAVTSGDSYWSGTTELTAEHDAATVNMGGRWRMPSKEEFEALIAQTTYSWVTNFRGSGMNGAKFSKVINNEERYIFMPAVGYDNGGVGSGGTVQLWSTTPGRNSEDAYGLWILEDNRHVITVADYYGLGKSNSMNIRGVLSL